MDLLDGLVEADCAVRNLVSAARLALTELEPKSMAARLLGSALEDFPGDDDGIYGDGQ